MEGIPSESEGEVETVEDPVWRQSQIQVTIHGTESEEEVEPFEKSDGLLERTEADWQKDYAIAPSEPDEANAPGIEGGHEQHSDTGHDYTLQADDIMDDDFVPLPPGTQSPELEHVPSVVEPIPVDPEVQAIHDRVDWLARLEALPYWNEFRSYTAEDIDALETRPVDVDMWTKAMSPKEYGRRFTSALAMVQLVPYRSGVSTSRNGKGPEFKEWIMLGLTAIKSGFIHRPKCRSLTHSSQAGPSSLHTSNTSPPMAIPWFQSSSLSAAWRKQSARSCGSRHSGRKWR